MGISDDMGTKYGPIARPGIGDRPPQSVATHVLETAQLASGFCLHTGLSAAAELIGLLHDLGKNGGRFQEYIRDPSVRENGGDHSTAGAKFLWDYLEKKSSRLRMGAYQVLALCIASHHGGLIDSLRPDGEDLFSRRMAKADVETSLASALENMDQNILETINHRILKADAVRELEASLMSISGKGDSSEVEMTTIGLLMRFLFSALVDADRMSAAGRKPSSKPDWRILARRLEERLARFDRKSEIDVVRQELSDACRAFAHRGKGLFKLSAPTGGGKTLASLRYALHHAERYGMSRIVYVIPYTSIIEQNAETVRAILERDGEPPIVLEHHSNVVQNEEVGGQEETRASLLAENWDAPIVFTTSVQFLNALFDGATRSSRRMHRLSNAVVIFDEVQTIPVKTIHLFNIAANFLVDHCGSTLLMCTATQPLLDGVNAEKGAIQFTGTGKESEIFQGGGEAHRFRRVEVVDRCSKAGWSEEDIVDLVLEEAKRKGNVLTVTNSRKWAKTLFERCAPFHEAVFHLSAAMCPAHRNDTLHRIKERIDPERQSPTICISTQLIEAGVDVDFNAGVRFLAGLDSMAQAAGRINRNGRRPLCRMTIVNPARERITQLPDILVGKDKARRALQEFEADPARFGGDILSPELMYRYYQYYFYDRADEMEYRIRPGNGLPAEDSLLSLLSHNTKGVREYALSNGNSRPPYPFRHAFKTAGRLFEALDSPTSAVVVPYGEEGRELVAQLCSAHYDPDLWHRLLQRAQRFAVNIYPHQVKALNKQDALHFADEDNGVMVLDECFYSDNLGVVLEPAAPMPLLMG